MLISNGGIGRAIVSWYGAICTYSSVTVSVILVLAKLNEIEASTGKIRRMTRPYRSVVMWW
jgi:hypothetical protein